MDDFAPGLFVWVYRAGQLGPMIQLEMTPDNQSRDAAKIAEAVFGHAPTDRAFFNLDGALDHLDQQEAVRVKYPEYMDAFELHFHDTRGTAATKFSLAGFEDEEVAEILGWEKSKVTKIIDRYVRRGARLKAKIQRMNQAWADSGA